MGTRAYSVEVTTTGGAGVAAGAGSVGIPHGKLVGVQVDYKGMPATTDVTLKCKTGGVEKTLLTLTDKNTDIPLQTIHEAGLDSLGVAVAAGKNAELVDPVVGGQLTVDVAQADAGAPAVVVSFVLEV